MAERPKGYGMTAELADKNAAKYSLEHEQEAVRWINRLLPEVRLGNITGAEALHAKLKDGNILCQLINKLQPGSVPKINTVSMPFKQMENIGNFLTSCERFGLRRIDMFQTVDLYEAQNMAQVVDTLHALGRKAQTKGLSGIGPKEAESNPRQFSEDQLRQGEGIIGLQAGWNKGATQSGQNFGKTRQILD